MDLAEYAFKKEQEDMTFIRWCVGYQHMSYEEFKQALQPIELKPEAEVLEDVGNILEAMR